jgi:hypothetical protein
MFHITCQTDPQVISPIMGIVLYMTQINDFAIVIYKSLAAYLMSITKKNLYNKMVR